ncbi:hypothetical protein DERP_003163 [Dermatophagoides pteronyssinus]|uniref:Uncharacterized protein n=1 Tax=Dermatophagoides pteronyssinus TaxID=6956 RepID=A0ABQ8JJ68_DERPT|nr:hypothetical protein DERP_003163 [Dermatophagoides pteronyssinus]
MDILKHVVLVVLDMILMIVIFVHLIVSVTIHVRLCEKSVLGGGGQTNDSIRSSVTDGDLTNENSNESQFIYLIIRQSVSSSCSIDSTNIISNSCTNAPLITIISS